MIVSMSNMMLRMILIAKGLFGNIEFQGILFQVISWILYLMLFHLLASRSYVRIRNIHLGYPITDWIWVKFWVHTLDHFAFVTYSVLLTRMFHLIFVLLQLLTFHLYYHHCYVSVLLFCFLIFGVVKYQLYLDRCRILVGQ